MTAKERKQLTLTEWLIQIIDTPSWRAGTVTGEKHPRITQKDIDAIGRQELLTQAEELEKQGLIRVKWREFHTDIEKIDVSVDAMRELCKLAGVPSPKEELAKQIEEVEAWKAQAQAEANWLEPYYAHLLEMLAKGNFPRDVKGTESREFFRCLNAVAKEKEPTWKRIFSAAILNDSKKFEREYEGRILTILKNHSPKVQEGMTDQEMLAEHGIQTYSQSLELKGAITYRIRFLKGDIDETPERIINTEDLIYGTILNAQTLTAASLVGLAGIKKVITIENKANYESMEFKEDTLYIYCHGFFAPKERRFLEQIPKLSSQKTQYYHWGDMDYGGIRIYNFIKKNLFPKLQPYRMDEAEYKQALNQGAGIPLEAQKRKKLESMVAGDLEELKKCILKHNMEIEQEVEIDTLPLMTTQ